MALGTLVVQVGGGCRGACVGVVERALGSGAFGRFVVSFGVGCVRVWVLVSGLWVLAVVLRWS